MKIAFLADIHSNFSALGAVLNDLRMIDMIVCCGDIVGYYPDANQVCDLLRETDMYVIRGNHDAYVIGEIEPNKEKAPLFRTNWTRSQLKESHINWLKTLPVELRFKWNNLYLIIRHASPWDERTYLYVDSSELSRISLKKNEILVIGHTHYPLLKNAGEGIIVNPGSVGQPRDYNPKSCYAVLETQSRTVEHKRVVYDVNSFQNRLRSLDWEDESIRILSRERRIE